MGLLYPHWSYGGLVPTLTPPEVGYKKVPKTAKKRHFRGITFSDDVIKKI